MNLSYDPKANVAYIRFREAAGRVETLRLTEDFHVDVDETGAVCGVELLNANEQLTAGDDGKLVFVNALNGERSELKVA
jgi:uncharacterized protein YuzE